MLRQLELLANINYYLYSILNCGKFYVNEILVITLNPCNHDFLMSQSSSTY